MQYLTSNRIRVDEQMQFAFDQKCDKKKKKQFWYDINRSLYV